ncbi:hypothetical protein KDA_43530 [Dictyobacter alpinus]|uniref:3-keto-disaccharide hydrolase domain-containing protein n=1 Tax=Dictyobacter alpinus TaxID=2014873 RepID=A0A402BC05_9CHLR|nr:hypothetical protein [Dictyobacter alpinus]GCE28869.1 hypothetical protein KDA_43530 [Dictyobacter alpinus]
MLTGNRIRRYSYGLIATAGLCCLLLFNGLVACSPGTTGEVNTSTTPRPTPTKSLAGTVLYQSSWAGGLKVWQATAGWKLAGDYAQTDLGEHRMLTIPYRPTVANYALEFQLQVVEVPKDGGYFIVKADPQSSRDGFQSRILNLLDTKPHGYATHPLVETVIDPDMHQQANVNAQAFDYEPGSQWHTYRVEVSAEQTQFFADNVRISRASSAKTATLSNGPLRLDCGKAILRVKGFEVTAL